MPFANMTVNDQNKPKWFRQNLPSPEPKLDSFKPQLETLEGSRLWINVSTKFQID